jgi:hypothetical protein
VSTAHLVQDLAEHVLDVIHARAIVNGLLLHLALVGKLTENVPLLTKYSAEQIRYIVHALV